MENPQTTQKKPFYESSSFWQLIGLVGTIAAFWVNTNARIVSLEIKVEQEQNMYNKIDAKLDDINEKIYNLNTQKK